MIISDIFQLYLIIFLIGVMACFTSAKAQHQNSPKQETVVLLHGLVRSSKAMNKIERKLEKEGYEVINIDYPSTTATIETHASQIFSRIDDDICQAKTVHFVTHSMGGIILREHLEHQDMPNLGRVVMLAPPSQGSEVPDKLGHLKPFQWINGPAGNQLGTGTDSHPLRLSPPTFELGIIAGDRTINPILSMLIPGPDDGKVSLARVKPDTYTDYIQLHVTHPGMVWNRNVISQTIHFLENGTFNKSSRCASPKHRTAGILPAPQQSRTAGIPPAPPKGGTP